MNNVLRFAIPAAIFLLLASAAYMTQHSINSRGQDPDPDQIPTKPTETIEEYTRTYPPIELIDSDQITTMLDNATGKVVVLNLWATWCAPCVYEMPELVQFYQQYQGDNLTFISISADDIDTINTAVQPFQKKLRLNFPIYLLGRKDPALLSKILKGHFVDKYPTTYIYDKNGNAKNSAIRRRALRCAAG